MSIRRKGNRWAMLVKELLKSLLDKFVGNRKLRTTQTDAVTVLPFPNHPDFAEVHGQAAHELESVPSPASKALPPRAGKRSRRRSQSRI